MPTTANYLELFGAIVKQAISDYTFLKPYENDMEIFFKRNKINPHPKSKKAKENNKKYRAISAAHHHLITAQSFLFSPDWLEGFIEEGSLGSVLSIGYIRRKALEGAKEKKKVDFIKEFGE